MMGIENLEERSEVWEREGGEERGMMKAWWVLRSGEDMSGVLGE